MTGTPPVRARVHQHKELLVTLASASCASSTLCTREPNLYETPPGHCLARNQQGWRCTWLDTRPQEGVAKLASRLAKMMTWGGKGSRPQR
eukprot:scaffold7267_cov395-Prasinococcus_capsulatus_cf.AAC.5